MIFFARSHWRIALLTSLTGAFFSATLAAQTPPPPAKRLPPAGIAISDADRAELSAGVTELQREIRALAREHANEVRNAGRPWSLENLPDVEIFAKAVDWALRYDEFFAPKEVAVAKHLLAEGRARVAQLRAMKTPWRDATGLVVRGHRSAIDGSVQPYGLVVPPGWKRDQPGRLMVWLLGRGEKRTELAFLAEREAGPPQLVPPNTLVLIPYGRFCNATKFAGETDVFEAMNAVREDYQIDPARIIVAGFSMGGASAWHLAAHHASEFCVASPGAGFAETSIYTKALAPGKEPPRWWEQKLWHWYDATDYAANLFNCPVLAYSGEIDPQKQSADLMEKAMAGEGLKLERFIGPQTAHKYEPATRDKLIARIDEFAAKGRAMTPREVHLTTYTLRYPTQAWVDVLGLEQHWERADVRARIEGDTARVETKNVSMIRALPAGRIIIDGQEIDRPRTEPENALEKRYGKWEWIHFREETFAGERKMPGSTGPIDDAFMTPFVFVRPTGKPLNDKLGAWTQAELAHATKMWRDIFRGEVKVIDDRVLGEDENEIYNSNLILWGDPSSNEVIAQILRQLPLKWDARKLEFRGKTYDAAHHAPILIFPNPLNPGRYVVLNSGIDFREHAYGTNALQIPKLPDYAIVDLREPPGPRWPGKIVEAGFFDEEWK